MPSSGFECKNVGLIRRSRTAAERVVLQGLNAVFAGGSVALVNGPTGSGKSTLLHILSGLLRPTEGELLADGQPVSRWLGAHRDRWRRQVGVIFQQTFMFPGLTVLENVLLPLIPRPMAIGDMRRRAMTLLRDLDAAHLAAEFATTLSGGERQRVAVARALVMHPRFLLADEPTAHQDDAHADLLVRALAGAARRNAVVVIAAHDARVPLSAAIREHFQLENGGLRRIK